VVGGKRKIVCVCLCALARVCVGRDYDKALDGTDDGDDFDDDQDVASVASVASSRFISPVASATSNSFPSPFSLSGPRPRRRSCSAGSCGPAGRRCRGRGTRRACRRRRARLNRIRRSVVGYDGELAQLASEWLPIASLPPYPSISDSLPWGPSLGEP
jgi:hypothetical protein